MGLEKLRLISKKEGIKEKIIILTASSLWYKRKGAVAKCRFSTGYGFGLFANAYILNENFILRQPLCHACADWEKRILDDIADFCMNGNAAIKK